MNKKRFILIIMGLIFIVSIIVITNAFQNRISSSINKNGDSLPIIDGVIEKRYIKREEGKDTNGNFTITLYYNPNDIDEADINSFETLLCEDYEFYLYDEDNFEDGIRYAGISKEKDKMWIITIFYDNDEAYVRYTKCNNTMFVDIDENGQDFNNETKNEENGLYFDSETNEYFDDYEDYKDYLFYKDFDKEYTPEEYDEELTDEELKNEQSN